MTAQAILAPANLSHGDPEISNPIHAANKPPILVVDDENGPRQALRVLLNEEYTVHIVEDVDSALRVLADEPIELVITDVRMPKRTGVELLRETKKTHPDVQVIVLTGYGQLETAVKAVEYGAFSYMEKPFDNDAMLDMVRAGLEKYREERDRRALEFLSLEANRFETLGRVVSGMMHDLGSPLTVLGSQIDLVAMDPERGDLTGRLSIMRQQVEHCGDLVRTTMNFMRNEPDEFIRHDLNDIIITCLDVAAPQLRDVRVTVTRELADSLPLIAGDLVLIRQAILNLITNACAAMSNTEATREIAIRTSVEANCIVLAVEDTGPGIPSTHREKVFETFYTTKGKDGTGLGLSVVRNVMRRHSGSVALEDGQGSGACFVLRFPIEV